MPLLRSTLVYAATSIVGSAIPFVLLPILTRTLTPADYGSVTAFTIAIAVLGALTGLSVHGAVSIRYFERDRYDLPRYVGACLITLMTSSTIVALLCALAWPWIADRFGLPTPWLLVATAVSAAQFVILIRLALYQSAGKVWQFGILRVLQAALDAGTSLLFVLTLAMGWQGRALGITLATVATAAIALRALVATESVKMAGSGAYVPDAIRYGAPLVLHVLGGLLITTGDKMVVGAMLSLDELGQYAVAAQVATVLNVLYDAIFKAFQPWVIQRALIEEQRLHVVRSIYKLLTLTTLMGVSYLVVAWFAYPLLVGDRYKSGRFLLAPLVVAGIIRCGYFATAIFINIAGRNAYLARNSVASGVAGLAVAVTLIPEFGVLGAAFGVVVAELSSFALNLRSSMHVYPMPWRLR